MRKNNAVPSPAQLPIKNTVLKNFEAIDWEHEVDAMPHFAVFCNPSDYPGKFVVRLLGLKRGKGSVKEPSGRLKVIDTYVPMLTGYVTISDTLDGAHQSMPAGLHQVARHPNEKPYIVETWFR